MPRTAVITQPTYLPWLGYFEQMARADVFVFLDTVQFARRSWQSRNRLRVPGGPPFWLTVPVRGHRRVTAIKDIRIHDSSWQHDHLKSIRHALGNAAFFGVLSADIEAWLLAEWERLVDLNIAGIRMIARWLGLQPEFVRASDLGAQGRKVQLLLAICAEVGADHYYSSTGSKSYIDSDPDAFARAGITLEYQMWAHPLYAQGSPDFVSHLSALDPLTRLGPQRARELLHSPSTRPEAR